MSINKPLIVIVGPTASGKTKLSIKIAKRFSGEIICADSMTVYREMDIGTAKPTNKERKAIPYHLLDIKNPKEDFSLYEFQKLAKKAITKIQSEGKLPLIVGGTGLFIDCIAYDYKLINVPPNLTLRKKLEKLESKELLERINKIDPELIATSDIKNKRRLIRALEIASSGQNNISKQKRKKKIPKNILYLAI
nr:tRNA (adenosine(37)-N6)-dimethylallyltransferase MiaA [Candidatus Aenigmarchaeota archaeon]